MYIFSYHPPHVIQNYFQTQILTHCVYHMIFTESFNPSSPHDALKHHFTSLKTQFISLQLRVLEGKFL